MGTHTVVASLRTISISNVSLYQAAVWLKLKDKLVKIKTYTVRDKNEKTENLRWWWGGGGSEWRWSGGGSKAKAWWYHNY